MIYDFFLLHGFVLELLIASALFVFSLRRRRLFAVRLLAPVGALFLISFLWNAVFEINPWTQLAKYTLMFFVAFSGVVFCFKTSFWVALFCEVGAYATQHLAFKIASSIQILLGSRVDVKAFGVIYILIAVMIYTASYFIFARQIKKNEAVNLENRGIILLSIALLLFTNMFQFIFEAYLVEIRTPIFLVMVAYDVMCGIFTLCIQYGIFRAGALRRDNKMMEHILYMQKSQLGISKDSIDVINIKCHDLKHQISRLGDRISKEEIEELNKVITIYDASLQTGNEALDVILAEKSLLCEKNNIKFECIANGKILSFISASDIYSLFGNAIDNAIEAVNQIDDVGNRHISLSIKESMGMASVHVENYFKGELVFADELPVTTKSNREFHGFGMKSIRMIVEKYNGYLTVKTTDNIFNLNILFRSQENTEKPPS